MFAVAVLLLVLFGFTQPALAATGDSSNPVQTTLSSKTAGQQATSNNEVSNGHQAAQPTTRPSTQSSTNQPKTTGTTKAPANNATPATQPTVPSNNASQTDYRRLTSSFSVDAENLATHRQLKNGDSVSQYTPIRINFHYDFTGQNVEPGDYFTFSFSPSLSVIGPTQFKTNQGLVQLNGNSGKFTFQGQGGSDAHGFFYVSDQVNSQATSMTVPVFVNINDNEHMRINVDYTPNPEQGPTEAFSKYTMNNNLHRGNIEYALRINASGQASYDDAVISDHLNTPGFTYDQKSFQIRQVVWTWNGSGWDNRTVRTLSLQPTFSADDTSFTIDFGKLVQQGTGYLVLYDVLYDGQPVNELASAQRPATGTVISNTASLAGTNHQTITKHQTLVIVDYGGNGDFNNFNVTVEKTGANGAKLANATFQLLQNGRVVASATTNANGKAFFNDLHYGNYVLHESQAPAGYQTAADQNLTIASENSNHNITVNVQDAIITTSATVRKVWNDANDQDGLRPTSVTVNLLANGQVTQTVTLSANNNWTATVDDLPAYTNNGQSIVYAWAEANVPAGYTSSVNGNVITNSHHAANTYRTVRKVWNDDDDQDGLRPTSVTVNLLANGQVVRTLTLTAAQDWTATVFGLPVNADGQAIDYVWQEVNVPVGYTSAVDGDVITNTHAPKPTTPTTPTTPTHPTTPTTPTTPITPTTPNQPSPKTTPVVPNVPTTPVHPTTPTTPEKPNQPTQPSPKTTPVEPNVPMTPTTPVKPIQPNWPTPKKTPVQLNRPQPQGQTVPVSKPVTPVTPAIPQKDATPSETKLPQTGNQHNEFALVVLGLLMIVFSSAMVDVRKN